MRHVPAPKHGCRSYTQAPRSCRGRPACRPVPWQTMETKPKTLDARSGSGMTGHWMPDQAGHDRRGCCPYVFLRHPRSSIKNVKDRLLVIEDPVSLFPVSLSSAVVPGACGRGCAPVPSIPYGGEDCLSAALVLSGAKELSISDRLPTKNRFFTAFRMTTFGFSWGPRPGANGFGSFCRNKRTSSCGAETPHVTPRRWMHNCWNPTSLANIMRYAGHSPDQMAGPWPFARFG